MAFVKKDNWVIEVADEEVEKYLNPVQEGDEKWELATQEEFDAREKVEAEAVAAEEAVLEATEEVVEAVEEAPAVEEVAPVEENA